MATDAYDVLSGRVLGEFTLLDCLDEGAFGAVYRARQEGLQRPAVVKVLHRRAAAGAETARFVREAQLGSRIEHPYATKVYAFGVEDDGLLWIAMEFIGGVSFRRWIRDRGPMPLETFVPFFERVAQVVQAAHDEGIVHRDLKPDNIMVIESAGALLPKLLDFGVAKLLDDVGGGSLERHDGNQASRDQRDPVATPTGAWLGTAAYMAPELWADPLNASPATDLYALAVIAFEALTGRRPYNAGTHEECLALHCFAPVPTTGPLSLRRALAKEPGERYGAVVDLAAALRAEADGRLVAQIRGAARAWQDRDRPAGLLWGGEVLAELERWVRRTGETAADAALTSAEIDFVAASRDAADRAAETATRRLSRDRRLGLWVAGLMIAIVFGTVQGRAYYETRIAQQRAADAEHEARATAITAEVEQGRAALLHDDMAEAQRHLGEAWRRGDHSAATAFMYARALQPLRAEIARLPAAAGRMWSSSWSPDGRWIATSDDRGARIWRADTYELLHTLQHGDVVYAAVWAGSERLVTACGDGAVRIWDVAHGTLVRELRLAGRSPRWYALAVGAGGRAAAVDARGGLAAIWDGATGAVLAELPLDGASWPSIGLSADGRWVAASGGGPVHVLDTATWRHSTSLGEQVRAIAWSPAGPRLLAGEATGTASIWNVQDGARQAHQLGEAVTAVAFSPDGSFGAIGGEDGAEQIVEVASARVASQGNHLHVRVASLAFSADGLRVVAAGAAGELAIGVAASGLPVEVLEGPTQQLVGAAFGPTGRRVLAASWDGTARIWDARSPYRQWSAARISSGYGLFGGAEPDGRYLAIACPGCATRVWDTAKDQLLGELPVVTAASADAPVPFPVVSPAGDRAAIARDASAELYELPGGGLVRSIKHAAPVTALAFGPGGELFSGDADGAVLETRGEAAVALAPRRNAGIAALVVLGDHRIAASDTAGNMRILDETGARVVEFNTGTATARMLRASPDGRQVLVVPFHAGPAAPMTILDEHGVVSRLESPPVYAARWVDHGRAILSAHADGAARLWDVTGMLLRTYIGGARFLADADMSPDGTLVVGAGGDGVLRFWDTATGRALWVVAAHRPYVMSLHFGSGGLVTRGIGGEVARWNLPDPNAVIRGVAEPAR